MKSLITQLVEYSYTNGELDEERIAEISKRLQRSQLKAFVKGLILEERKKHVIITTAQKLSIREEDALRKLFPEKKVIFQTEPTLISGIRILNNDVIYEKNLAQMLHDLTLFLEKN